MEIEDLYKVQDSVIGKILYMNNIYFDYIIFFHSRGYCSNLEPIKYTRIIKGYNKEHYGYEFNTFTFISFN